MFLVKNSHPYGVTPAGNAFFQNKSIRITGLGNLKLFSDQIMLDILSYCSGIDLGKLCQTSLTMYVFSHHVDLWRDLTLKLCHNQPCDFYISWKDTYASLHHNLNLYNNHHHQSHHSTLPGQGSRSESGSIPASLPAPAPVPHQPISVSNFSSDLLYRSWVAREFDLEISCPGFFNFSNIDRRDVTELSTHEFVEKYEKFNKPVVITGLVTQWEAFQKWNFEYFKQFYSTQIFRATSGTSSESALFTMKQYESYSHSNSHEEVPLYLFDRNFGHQRKESLSSSDSDCSSSSSSSSRSLADDYIVPEYFTYSPSNNDLDNTSSPHLTDLFSLLPTDIRPDYRWLIIGPRRSGSIFHIDPNQTHAWNACIKGRKKWIFYPPNTPPPGIYVSSDGGDVTVPLSTGEWLLSFWKYHLRNRRSPASLTSPLEVIVNPGELIYVPHGWWHMVINLDEESIAITQNYVSTTNLSDCYEFLRDKFDQISGLRDRYNTQEFHQNFHEIFSTTLRRYHCSLYERMRSECEQKQTQRQQHRQKIQSIIPSSITKKKKRMMRLKRGMEEEGVEEEGVEEEGGEGNYPQRRRRQRSNSNYEEEEEEDREREEEEGEKDFNSLSSYSHHSNIFHECQRNSSHLNNNSSSFSFSFNFQSF